MKSVSALAAGVLAAAATVSGCSHQPAGGDGAGWVTLFDGTGFDNWTAVGSADWRLADGAVVADHGNGFLVSRNAYSDFQIRVEFWVSDNANSGIYMRCADPAKLTDTTCYEANIFDQRPDPTYGTGAVVHIAPISPMPKAGGKWNVYEITAKGPKITVVLNGARTVEAQDGKLARGPIGLQYAAGVVKFRKVQIRPL
jgi:hypothetical protein